MHNKDYQEDWFKTMNDYQLVENNSEYDYGDGVQHGSGYIINFCIPEGTGKHWEEKFMEYNFVRWAEMSYSRYIIH